MSERQPTRHTKRRLMELLKRDGPADASSLAELVGISAMAVRQHLYALSDDDLVSFDEVRKEIGRPVKKWRLTEKAQAFFPDAHAELVLDLLDATTQVFGQDGLARLVQARAAQQIDAYSRSLSSLTALSDRLDRLAELRTTEGYMASVEAADGGAFLLVENHCPVCAAAKSCTGLCASELEVFQAVLGDEVQIRRIEHLLNGARRCAYLVESAAQQNKGRPSGRPSLSKVLK